MTVSKSDFPHIKSGALTFLSALALGGGVLAFSEIRLTQAQQDQQSAQRRMNDAQHQLAEARNRLTIAQDDQKNMATYAREYALLEERKIIGSEQRLDWIEGLDSIRRQSRVLNFTYSIAPQHPYTPALPVDAGNYDLNLSPMTLQFDLLHEAQLIDFFDTLRASIKGSFILDHCALTRSGAAFEDRSAPQLKAECTGGWVTLKNRNQK